MLCALLLMMEQSVESPSMDYDSVNAAVYAIFWSWGVFVTCCLAIVPLRLLWNNYQVSAPTMHAFVLLGTNILAPLYVTYTAPTKAAHVPQQQACSGCCCGR